MGVEDKNKSRSRVQCEIDLQKLKFMKEGEAGIYENIMSTTNNDHFEIEVETGPGRGHNTNGDVFITLYGSTGTITDAPLLDSSKKNLFERGKVDKFQIEGAKIGNIQKVTLKLQPKGRGPAWFVKRVTISEYVFQFNRWFSKRGGWEHSAVENLSVKKLAFAEGYEHVHRTNKFKSLSPTKIILRKGNNVKLNMTLKRPFTNTDGEFEIVLSTGQRPRESKGTMAVAQMCSNHAEKEKLKDQGKWAFEITEQKDTELVIELFVPSDTIVGSWKLHVEHNDSVVYEFDGDVIILYNPWCETDEVYMQNAKDIKEYVITQSGIVYQGNKKRQYPKQWYFGQFEEVVLEVLVYLLERIPVKQRRSVVTVARAFTSLCNSFDNDGVLEGNWSGDYSGGKTPSFWTTTPVILQTYIENDHQPVKFGQCWVFSALLTTMMRALGIPCRSVTNFDSAHDTDANVTNDIYINSNNERDEEKTNDSVWNFHVWNDVWFRRDDLRQDRDEDFDGWQAIDATPQELSSGLYQMGPSPLKAIKLGLVDKMYDSKFVFSEVNAETVYWRVEEGKEPTPISRRTDRVGHNISTKQVGSMWRDDITNEYKFEDGSLIEKASVRTALEIVNHPMVVDEEKGLEATIKQKDEETFSGEPVEVELQVENKTKEDSSVLIIAKAILVDYTNEPIKVVSEEKRKVKITKENVFKMLMTVQPTDYVRYMRGDESISVHLTAVIPGTKHIASTEEGIDLMKPKINITLPEEPVHSEAPVDVTVTFDNPLDVALTDCQAYLGGSVLKQTKYDLKVGEIPAKSKFSKTYTISPARVFGELKKKSLVFSFNCKPIGGFSEMVRIRVSDK